MDVWAEKYFGRASFICVGCDGPQLAVAFAQRLQLSKCMLTYVDDKNGPKWGQLGCNGFIILGADGKVVNPKTSAFLEVNELAFSHVESILDSLVEGTTPSVLQPGVHVELHGLGKAELNGTRGFIVEAPTNGRCAIDTYYGKRLSVKPDNVRVLPDDEGEEGGEDGDEADFDRTTGGCSTEPKKQKQAVAGGGCAECDEMPERMKRALAKDSAPQAVAPLAAIHSVHVDDLDAEHEQCAAALAELTKAPTRAAIERVLEAYTAHFAHEEAMLDTHLYTAAATATAETGGFSKEASMRRSHYADHEKMLRELRSTAAALPATGGSAPAAFVDSVLRAFENHANVYDAAYAEPLAAKLRDVRAVPAH